MATLTEGGVTWTNTYNADGLRIKRTNGTLTYQYYYVGGQLVRIAIGNKYIDFSYDASGVPMSLYYSGYGVTAANYYYVTNLQGDVVAILDDAGTAVVTYAYDAWGNILTVGGSMADTLGAYNPLRYRGYVYDVETSLYYLQSRYYDPEIGRFINADCYNSTDQGFVGNNMFVYCLNDPINCTDSTGELAFPGEIHNEVVRRIANEYGLFREQHILYNIGYGRADLISSDGQVWDVKRDRKRHIKAGIKQVAKYAGGTWANNPDVELSVGGPNSRKTDGVAIKSDSFKYRSGLFTYKVSYKYAGNGVITYDYVVEHINVQPVAAFAFGMAMGCVFMGGGAFSAQKDTYSALI